LSTDDFQSLQNQEDMPERTFEKLTYEGPVIKGKRFERCQFIGCRFTGRSFVTCTFDHCHFVGCDLSNLEVEGLRFIETLFDDCKLLGIPWTKAKSDAMTSFHYTGCTVDYSDFERDLRGLRVIRCSAKQVNFRRANLTDAECRDTDFEESVFEESNLTRADFCGARNYAIDLTQCKAKGARFSLPEALSLLSVQGIVIE
jgi:fluoroquinolone resistance protein